MDTEPTYNDPVALLQHLLKFDTTNPPGNEAACVSYIRNLLNDAGIETTIIAKDPDRPNLIARLKGRGEAPPFLMYGHVDVVTTEGQSWSHPPFGAEIIGDYLWGRGTLDMKGGVAMMLAAFLRSRAKGLELPGDVILAILSDEEGGSDMGARFVVEQHPEHVEGVRYAIGEFGGFTMHIGRRAFYPIMITEKQMCWMQATVRGRGGHGSMPVRGEAMARLSDMLRKLDRKRLPVHITPAAEMMFRGIGDELGGITGFLLKLLLNPLFTDLVLDRLGDRTRLFDPLLHNTVSPTMLKSCEKVNVIPHEVCVGLDGRLLPGQRPNDIAAELQAMLGEDVEIEVLRNDPIPPLPDLGLFETLAAVLKEADPDGIPVPYMAAGTTDGRYFSRLGIQTYGYIPLKLPADFNFSGTIHGADERVPVEAIRFGTNTIYTLLQRLH
jgi:acetylornithine deacetylase/succinyl-diaminopimelate desuccinylase-like protein